MRNSVGLALIVCCFACSPLSFAAGAWYQGAVTRLSPYAPDGSFVVTMAGGALNGCAHNYAYFNVATLGEFRVKQIYALALTSLTTKMRFGVVLDKEAPGPGGVCNAVGMAADLVAD